MESVIQRFLNDAPIKGMAMLEDTFRRVKDRKSTYLLAGLLLIPALLAFVLRIDFQQGYYYGNLGDEAASIFLEIFVWVYLRLLVIVAVLLIAMSLLQEEREDKTLPLLLTSPLSRFEVIFYKYVAVVPIITVLTWVPVVVTYLAFMFIGAGEGAGAHLGLLGVALFLIFLSVSAYTAVIFAITAIFRKPLLPGAIFVFFWEQGLGLMSFWLQKLTISHYIRSATVPLLSGFTGKAQALDTLALTGFFGGSIATDWVSSLFVLVAVSLLFFALSVMSLSAKDVT